MIFLGVSPLRKQKCGQFFHIIREMKSPKIYIFLSADDRQVNYNSRQMPKYIFSCMPMTPRIYSLYYEIKCIVAFKICIEI